MAFGPPPEPKPLKITPNVEDQLWRSYVKSEETAATAWKTKWGWILGEYNKLQEDLKKVSEGSVMIPPPSKPAVPDTRTTRPFSNTTGHDVGWLASRREFKLEKFGKDVYKGMPFVSLSGV